MQYKALTTLIGSSALAIATFSASAAVAWDQDSFGMYFRRSDTVTASAGDARDTNAVAHVIDPWPRYVRNRRIPADGGRMARAIERYRCIDRSSQGVPPLAPLYNTQIGIAGTASAIASAATAAVSGGCAETPSTNTSVSIPGR